MRLKGLEPSPGTGSVPVIEESAQQRLATGLWPWEGAHPAVAAVGFPDVALAKHTRVACFFQVGVHLVPVRLGGFVVDRVEREVIQASRVAGDVVQLLAGPLVHRPVEVPRNTGLGTVFD